MIKVLPPHSAIDNNQGFTLVEILIAIVLLSFLMIGVYTVTDNSTTTIERVSREDADYAQVGTVINRLGIDLAQIYSPLYFSGLKKVKRDANNPYASQQRSTNKFFPSYSSGGLPIAKISQESSSDLTFFASSNRKKVPESKESHYCWIQYSLRAMAKTDSDDDGELKREGDYQLIRKVVATDPYTDDIDWEKVRPQPLLNNVKSFKFFFWSDKKERFTESLSDLKKPIIIRGVKILLEHYDVNNQLDTVEKIFLPLWPKFDSSVDDEKDKNPSRNQRENF